MSRIFLVPNNGLDIGFPRRIQRIFHGKAGYIQHVTHHKIWEEGDPFVLYVDNLRDKLDPSAQGYQLGFEGPYTKIWKQGGTHEDHYDAVSTVRAASSVAQQFGATSIWGVIPYRESQWSRAPVSKWERALRGMELVWAHLDFITVDCYLESDRYQQEWEELAKWKLDYFKEMHPNKPIIADVWHRWPDNQDQHEPWSLVPIKRFEWMLTRLKKMGYDQFGWWSCDAGPWGCKKIGIPYEHSQYILTQDLRPYADAFLRLTDNQG